jgi:hypothetical protein
LGTYRDTPFSPYNRINSLYCRFMVKKAGLEFALLPTMGYN